MTVDQLVFVGFHSRVVALDRDSGEIAWSFTSPKGAGYVSLLLDGDRLIVSVMGYTYCLEPLTGKVLWFNPLTGFGLGVASLASVNGNTPAAWLAAAAAQTSEEQSTAHVSTPPAQ